MPLPISSDDALRRRAAIMQFRQAAANELATAEREQIALETLLQERDVPLDTPVPDAAAPEPTEAELAKMSKADQKRAARAAKRKAEEDARKERAKIAAVPDPPAKKTAKKTTKKTPAVDGGTSSTASPKMAAATP